MLPGVVRAPGHLGHRRHPRLHRDGARPGLRLPGRRRGVLRGGRSSRSSADQPLHPRGDAGDRGRAGRQRRRPPQARPARLRAVAAVAGRRAVVGLAVGTGSTGLAHRVLGAVPARARHHDRPARRRQRPDLPAPRVRGGAVRGGDRRAAGAALDAPGDGPHGRREDVEVARQPGVRVGPVTRLGPRVDPAGLHRPPLPRQLGVERRADAGRRRAPAALGRGRQPAAAPSTRCAARSTTTSTRRVRSRRSTPPRRRAWACPRRPRCSASRWTVRCWTRPTRTRQPSRTGCRVREVRPPEGPSPILSNAPAGAGPGRRSLPHVREGTWRVVERESRAAADARPSRPHAAVPVRLAGHHRGPRARPGHGRRHHRPQPHLGARLVLRPARPAPPHHLRRQGRVPRRLEDEVPLPGDGHDPDRPHRRRRVAAGARRGGWGRARAGELFGIYPEGTRSRAGTLHKGHTGVARLALRTGCPIVPVGIIGTERAAPRRPVPAPFWRVTSASADHRRVPLPRPGQRPPGAAADHRRGDVRDPQPVRPGVRRHLRDEAHESIPHRAGDRAGGAVAGAPAPEPGGRPERRAGSPQRHCPGDGRRVGRGRSHAGAVEADG